MDPSTLVVVFLIGTLIGVVGVGGFLLVPVLVFLEGGTVREAVILAAVSFAGSGLVALAARPWRSGATPGAYAPFVLAAAPGAIGGALLVRVVPSRIVAMAIAVVVGLAAIAELYGIPRVRERRANRARAAMLGAFTGVASALTGTSGPLVAMPLLAAGGVPIVERIRLGQVAQLPIAACAAIVFLAAGDIAWYTALTAALALAAGTVLGMRATPALAPAVLQKIAATLMLLTACGMAAAAILR